MDCGLRRNDGRGRNVWRDGIFVLMMAGGRMREARVAAQRHYAARTVADAKQIAREWLARIDLTRAVVFGLPEVDDRYHIWRVPLLAKATEQLVGEVVIDAYSTLIVNERTTGRAVLTARLRREPETQDGAAVERSAVPLDDPPRNTIICGDSEHVLAELPTESIGLVFTSPPYYNARPEYTDYVTYEDYLHKLRNIIRQAHRVLAEGRFFVINVSPVLIRRAHRNRSSKRLAVPFDVHHLFVEEGYDFMDDIIWVKPEGAGWATGRGRRFAADRQPLQYKPVPVTEYVLVYRKHTDKLIDWNIRSHPDPQAVAASRIEDGYERTNVWRIKPSHSKQHPAVFPVELAERVIRYYSFIGDAVLDPFAGSGTTGQAAAQLGRRFVLIDNEARYAAAMASAARRWLGPDADLLCQGFEPPSDSDGRLPQS